MINKTTYKPVTRSFCHQAQLSLHFSDSLFYPGLFSHFSPDKCMRRKHEHVWKSLTWITRAQSSASLFLLFSWAKSQGLRPLCTFVWTWTGSHHLHPHSTLKLDSLILDWLQIAFWIAFLTNPSRGHCRKSNEFACLSISMTWFCRFGHFVQL